MTDYFGSIKIKWNFFYVLESYISKYSTLFLFLLIFATLFCLISLMGSNTHVMRRSVGWE